jgi:hypothetical protein
MIGLKFVAQSADELGILDLRKTSKAMNKNSSSTLAGAWVKAKQGTLDPS